MVKLRREVKKPNRLPRRLKKNIKFWWGDIIYKMVMSHECILEYRKYSAFDTESNKFIIYTDNSSLTICI